MQDCVKARCERTLKLYRGNKMVIELQGKMSKEEATEVVNVCLQVGKLLKKPERKLMEMFRASIIFSLVGIFLVVLEVCDIMRGKAGPLDYLCLGVALVATIMLMNIYRIACKRRKELLGRETKITLEFTEEGLGYEESDKKIKVTWDSFAFIRKFSRCICFMPKDMSGIIILVKNTYEGQIREYLQSTGINIHLIG